MSTSSSSANPTTTAPAAGLEGRRISVRPAKPSEAMRMARIQFDAFGPSAMSRLIDGPGGPTEDSVSAFAAQLMPNPPGKKAKDGGEKIVMVAELAPAEEGSEGQQQQQEPEIVAYSKWTVYRRPRTEAEWNVEEPPTREEDVGERVNVEVLNAFLGDLHRRTRELAKGEPRMHLNVLACSPEYGRMGAGAALLRWGLERADEAQLAVTLEASPPGYPLYVRHGFRALAAQDLPVTERWGLARQPDENWGQENAVDVCGPLPEGHFRTVFMRRPPKASGPLVEM